MFGVAALLVWKVYITINKHYNNQPKSNDTRPEPLPVIPPVSPLKASYNTQFELNDSDINYKDYAYYSDRDIFVEETTLIEILAKPEIIKPNDIPWVLQFIYRGHTNHWGVSRVAMAIRSSGELLSKEEVKALGLRGNTKIGRKYLEALTEKGRQDPVNSILDICQRLLMHMLHVNHLLQIKMSQDRGVKLYPKLLCSQYACSQAQRLNRQTFEVERFPVLPLAGCDVDCCTCTIVPSKSLPKVVSIK